MKNKALLLLLGVFLTSQAVYSEIKDTKAETAKKTEIKQVQNEKSPAENTKADSEEPKNDEEAENLAPETLAPAENNEAKAETVRKTMPARAENNKNKKPVKTKRQKAEETGGPALALELPNGEIVTGKNSELFGPTAAALINAIKKSADIAKEVKLIEPEVVKPIQGLKIDHLGSRNPRLHSNEILIALAITATENPDAARAMEELGNLKGSEAHSTIILTDEDKNVLRKLGINVTFDPYYQYDRLYRK